MIKNEREIRFDAAFRIASDMMLAARTAPKGRGKDALEMAIISGDDLMVLAKEMRKIAAETNTAFFARDAENIEKAQLCVLIGTRIEALGLSNCGLCGHNTCASKNKYPDVPCAFNTGDLGIAIGSAVSVAADARIDNRIMFSAGTAARNLNFLPKEIRIVYGIPLSISGKSPFFDRK